MGSEIALLLKDDVTGTGHTAPVPVLPGGSVTFEFDGLGAIEDYGA